MTQGHRRRNRGGHRTLPLLKGEILTLTLRVLHGKNDVKGRWGIPSGGAVPSSFKGGQCPGVPPVPPPMNRTEAGGEYSGAGGRGS